jgi:DNA-binding HxlR family transcriptional regulator
MREREPAGAFCPYYHRAVELIGSRWTGAIIRALLSGVSRFSEVVATVPGLSDRMLSERLKELEAEGIVTRTVLPTTPVRVEYRLTEKGQALAGVVESISEWASEWLAAQPPGKATRKKQRALTPASGGR